MTTIDPTAMSLAPISRRRPDPSSGSAVSARRAITQPPTSTVSALELTVPYRRQARLRTLPRSCASLISDRAGCMAVRPKRLPPINAASATSWPTCALSSRARRRVRDSFGMP